MADEQEDHGRGKAHDHIVDSEPDQRDQQDRSAPELVGEVAEYRSENELHQRVEEDHVAADHRRLGDAAAGQPADELRQHRQDDTQAHHVEQDGEKDTGEREFGLGRNGHCVWSELFIVAGS